MMKMLKVTLKMQKVLKLQENTLTIKTLPSQTIANNRMSTKL